MHLYSIEIEFEDGRKPYYRRCMDRLAYGDEIRKWNMQYDLELKRRVMNPNSDLFVTMRAKKKETEAAST